VRALVLALVCFSATALADTPPEDGLILVQRLGATDRGEVERAVQAIERAPAATPYLDEALREAARACEDVLADPARALALYDRILHEFPDGSASRTARVRARMLRDRIGENNAYAKQATELAQLINEVDHLPHADVIARAEALSAAAWPGAPDAALFLAEWHQRLGELDAAQRRFAAVEDKWPGTPQAASARRGGASTAILAHDWDRAERLAQTAPIVEESDRALRDELLDRVSRGRQLDFWYRVAWIVLALSVLGLLASLAEAARRGGKPPLKPPVEVLYLLPVGVVLVGVALTTHRAIAPAVCVLSFGGLVLAWISGITLELMRMRKRPIGVRAAINVVLCLSAVAALVYITLTHGDLLEMMIETVKFGPDP
jgi:tetratricopeptide (TPR) repeat protein